MKAEIDNTVGESETRACGPGRVDSFRIRGQLFCDTVLTEYCVLRVEVTLILNKNYLKIYFHMQ